MSNGIRFILFSILLLNCGPALAFSNSAFDPETYELKTKSMREDPLYPLRQVKSPNVVHDTPERPLSVSTGLLIRNIYYSLVPNSDTNQAINYEPNTSSYFNLSLNHYKSWGLSVATNYGEPEPTQIYGRSKYQDFIFQFPFYDWMIQAQYARYQGFYIANTNLVDSDWKSGDPYYQLPDMEAKVMMLNGVLVATPHRFSLKAFNNQTARQISSGGSWLVSVNLRRDKVFNPESIVPNGDASTIKVFQKVNDVYESESISFMPMIGYGYQYNFTENFGIAGIFMAGWGLAYVHRKGETEFKSYSESADGMSIEILFGYNGKEHFWGLKSSMVSADVKWGTIDFASSSSQSMFYYGMRL